MYNLILYCAQTPQTPMVRPWKYDYFDIDNYPLGTNAIVAVISYTVRVFTMCSKKCGLLMYMV